eukprot:UN01000
MNLKLLRNGKMNKIKYNNNIGFIFFGNNNLKGL